jgi:hypothetical protein
VPAPGLDAGARGRFPVDDTRGDAVLAVVAHPLREVGRLSLPGTPCGLPYDGVAQLLWVTLAATNEVVGLNAAGDQIVEVARFPTVRQPSTGRVYLGSRTTGQLQLIDTR